MMLLLMTRLPAAAVAVVLLLVHRVTAHDGVLIVAAIVYTMGSLAVLTALPRLQLSPLAWLVDCAAVLALVAASEDWCSPFYVLMLTALVLPSTGLAFRRALGRGLAPVRRPGSNGLRSMHACAATIGANLSIGPGPDGRGTSVVLSLSTDPDARS